MGGDALFGWEGNSGLAESNGSLPPGGWLQVLCGLPVHWDQLQAQCSVTSMGALYLFTYSTYLYGMYAAQGRTAKIADACLRACYQLVIELGSVMLSHDGLKSRYILVIALRIW